MAATDFSAFRTLVLAYCAVDGEAYISVTDSSSNTDFLAVANEVLKRFSEETLCLFADSIAFTLSTSTNTYSLRDTAVFAKEVIDVQRVYVNKDPILQTTEDQISSIYPRYLTDTASAPRVWFTIPPNHLVIYPKSDSAYANSYVSGWYVHPTITAESGAGGTISLRPEDIRCAAREVAIAILEPRASGVSLERVNYMRQENAAEKARIASRAEMLYLTPTIRRQGRKVFGLR